MRKIIATGTGPDDASQRKEFLVKFLGPLKAEDIGNAHRKMKKEKRVLKHIQICNGTTLHSRMNNDVTRDFNVNGGLSQLDGLHKVVPEEGGTSLESWRSRFARSCAR